MQIKSTHVKMTPKRRIKYRQRKKQALKALPKTSTQWASKKMFKSRMITKNIVLRLDQKRAQRFQHTRPKTSGGLQIRDKTQIL